MSKDDEIGYLKKIGAAGRERNINKLSQADLASRVFIDMGQIYSLLPPPPGRLLDFGCGAGWTSGFFALRGYDVTGIDISPDMIETARKTHDLPNLEFVVMDYENASLEEKYDCAVFHDSLHHAEDEGKAIGSAYKALKKGGCLVINEPGTGHSESPDAKEAMEKYGVIEKDMPPMRTIPILKRAGFGKIRTVPKVFLIHAAIDKKGLVEKLKILLFFLRKSHSGVVAAFK